MRGRSEQRCAKKRFRTPGAPTRGTKALADRYHAAVLLLHHTRKLTCPDVFGRISGTHGLLGAADAAWVLEHDRGSTSASLSVSGRDLEEQELELAWQPDALAWHLVGPAKHGAPPPKAPTGLTAEVLAYLAKAPGPLRPKDLAHALGKPEAAVRQTLKRLHEKKLVLKGTNGYVLASKAPDPTAVTP